MIDRAKWLLLIVLLMIPPSLVIVSGAEVREQSDTIRDLKSSNADLLQFYTVEKAKNLELEKRAGDRDSMEFQLRECLVQQVTAINHLEDIKWQMKVVIDTCPGRTRAPRLPRP